MAPLLDSANGNGTATSLAKPSVRFGDIPSAIDIPVSGLDTEEAVEVNLEELLDDTTELCTLLENEKASRQFWMTIAMAYAKKQQIDHAIEILNRGLASVSRNQPKDKLPVLTCICWMHLLKSRHAPRNTLESHPEMKTKDSYLQAATGVLNEASRINPAYPPLLLCRGAISLLRASLQVQSKPSTSTAHDTSERAESLRQAIKSFDDAIKASGGSNMLAVMGRARALYLLGKYNEALDAYQTVLRKMPSMMDPDPRVGIGCCLWQLNFKDQAKTAWKRSLDLNPQSKVANILLAIFYLYDSSRHSSSDPQFGALYKQAMTVYTAKAFKLDKDEPLTCATFSNYFMLRKQYDTVETLCRKAIELTDINAVASDGWYLLARKEHYTGESTKASEYYTRSDQARGGADKGYLPAKFGIIQMLVQSGDKDGAKFRLEKILQTKKNTESMLLLGALYAEEVFEAQASGSKEDKSAELKKAINLLESVKSSYKDDANHSHPDESVLIYLSRLYETANPEKSFQCLLQVEKIQMSNLPEGLRPPTHENEELLANVLREYLPPQLTNNIACYRYHTEKYEDAKMLFETALNACVKSQDKDAADEEMDALITTISYNLARTYEASGMTDEAKKLYEGVLEHHGDYAEAQARLTYIALRQSPSDEGPKRMSKLWEQESSTLEVRALFGWYLGRSKRRVANIAEDSEQRHYKHTLQNYDKHCRYSLTGMGNLHLAFARDMRRDSDQDKEKRSRMYEKAVEFFHKALQLDPSNAYAAQGIAIALIEDRKDYKEALQILVKAREAIRDASVHINLGHVYSELKNYTKAIESYETALSKDRARDTQILACLGRVWLLKARQDRSLPAFKTALEYAQRAFSVAPEQVHLEFNLAFLQNQIALFVIGLQDSQRTLADVEAASKGLDEAIESFAKIAKSKNPPYPRTALEQRATMGKNTISKQLERALQSQREYEAKNATKLEEARAKRDAMIKAKEDSRRAAEEAELEHKRKIAEERKKIYEETMKLAAATEARRRELEDKDKVRSDDDEDKEARKERTRTKRKKKADKDNEDRAGSAEGSDGEGERPKRRKLDKKRGGARQSKYKSSEIIVDSDDDDDDGLAAPKDDLPSDEESAAPTPKSIADDDDDAQETNNAGDGAEDEDEDLVARPTRKKVTRVIEDDDEDDDVEMQD